MHVNVSNSLHCPVSALVLALVVFLTHPAARSWVASVSASVYVSVCFCHAQIKYYNNQLFFNVQRDFLVQTGDPTGTGKGGSSLNGLLYGEQARFFDDEVVDDLTHARKGTVAMASTGPNTNGSQFYITTRDGLDYLDGKSTVFGLVAEGLDVLSKLNEAFVDEGNRPLQDIRIVHTTVLYDPFDDPPGLDVPDASPMRTKPPEETVCVSVSVTVSVCVSVCLAGWLCLCICVCVCVCVCLAGRLAVLVETRGGAFTFVAALFQVAERPDAGAVMTKVRPNARFVR